MEPTPRTWPTFAAELVEARACLQLPDEVGLAIRADRRRLGLSQRAYATRRRLTAAMVARLETRAAELKLRDVIRGLEGTDFVLCLCRRVDGGEVAATTMAPPTWTATPVPPSFWPRAELLARVRSGTRRFPAHHPAWQVDRPPLWWWNTEATYAYAVRPNWYAPRTLPWQDEAS